METEEKVETTPENTPESTEELEKKLAEAEAKRIELLKNKIAKLEEDNKALEIDKYVYPNPPQINLQPIINTPQTEREKIEERFMYAAKVMDTEPYGSLNRKKLFHLDERLPNGIPTIEAFGDWYNKRKELDELLVGVSN